MKQKNFNVFFDSFLFRIILLSLGILFLLLISGIFLTLIFSSIPSIQKFGLSFITSTNWDPVAGEFGALPFIIGTILTSILALLISLPFSLSVSIFLGEYFPSGFFSNILNSALELLAGIPSVVYGMWGLFFLAPLVRWLQTRLGVSPYGVGVFTASVVLAIMITPYSSSIVREVILMVPHNLKEAAFSLGATRYEVIKKVVFPYSSSGIIAGFLLAFGRALGETMAVTMVIGNAYSIPRSVFDPANTIASIIANEFTEATDPIYLSSLIQLALLLFVITFFFSLIGRIIVKNVSIQGGNLN